MRWACATVVVLLGGCSGATPHASLGAARDAGPRGDTGTIVYAPPPVEDAGDGPSVNHHVVDAGRLYRDTGVPRATGGDCIPAGRYRINVVVVDGVVRSEYAGDVLELAGNAVECQGTRIVLHVSLGPVVDTPSYWRGGPDGPFCLTLSTDGVSPDVPSGTPQVYVDFDGPF